MRILFLNPYFGKDFCRSSRWFAKSRGRVQRHPDYLCTAIAVLEKAGHECKFSDGQAKGLSASDTEILFSEFIPEMVVIQATTPSVYSDLEYAKIAKEFNPHIITVMVGAHTSAEPEDTLHKAKGYLDIVARGEYDYTLPELADRRSLESICGISYFDSGIVKHNSNRPFIEDLDSLPFPAWSHIDPYDYHDAGKLYPFITLLGGRGCDGKCTFCLFPQVMYGRRYRMRSKESIIDEIDYDLRLFPQIKEIMFEDDTFTLKRYQARLVGLCEAILRKRLKVKWSCNARADIEDISVLKLMKKAGCRMFCVGFEFGNNELLNRVHKELTIEKMRNFAICAHKAGIRIHGCFMIGGPGETDKTARGTIKFAKSLPLDTLQFSGVCAYPGTEFYRWCKQNNFLLPRDWPQWVDDELEQRAIINYPQLSNSKMNNLVDLGLKEFYLRPVQIWRILFSIRTRSELKTKLYGLFRFKEYFSKRRTTKK